MSYRRTYRVSAFCLPSVVRDEALVDTFAPSSHRMCMRAYVRAHKKRANAATKSCMDYPPTVRSCVCCFWAFARGLKTDGAEITQKSVRLASLFCFTHYATPCVCLSLDAHELRLPRLVLLGMIRTADAPGSSLLTTAARHGFFHPSGEAPERIRQAITAAFSRTHVPPEPLNHRWRAVI
jgi:hypothetical protein